MKQQNFNYINAFSLNHYKKDISEKLKEKINFYHQKHLDFIRYVLDENLDKIQDVVNEGFPVMSKFFFDEDDFFEMGDSLSDGIDDIFYPDIATLFENICVLEKKQEIFNIIIPNLIFRNYSFDLPSAYLSHTNDYTKALDYVKMFYGNNYYVNGYVNAFVKGAIYSENHDFFNSYMDIHKTKKIDARNILEPISKSIYLTNNIKKLPNNKSWIVFFETYYDLALKEVLSRKSFKAINEEIAIKKIYLDIIPCAIQILEESIKENNVNDIKNFICDTYYKKFNIKEPHLILIDCLYSDFLFTAVSNSESKLSLIFNDRRKSVLVKNINNAIEKALIYIDPIKCNDFFNKINLPNEWFKELSNYSKLSEKANEIDFSKEDRIKKI